MGCAGNFIVVLNVKSAVWVMQLAIVMNFLLNIHSAILCIFILNFEEKVAILCIFCTGIYQVEFHFFFNSLESTVTLEISGTRFFPILYFSF